MKKHYVNAVVSLLLQGKEVDVVLKNLALVLKKKGHEKIHASILKGVLLEMRRKQALETTNIILAKEGDRERVEKSLKQALQLLEGDTKTAHIIYDETLIGGFIASHKGKLINRSYKEKLVSLYRSITK